MPELNEKELLDMQSLFTLLTEEASNEESIIRARGFDLVRPPFKIGVQNRVIAKLYMRILALEKALGVDAMPVAISKK
jgi:hypothetical protein